MNRAVGDARREGVGPWRGRFAPTPSGALHLGGARTAYAAFLSARARGGELVLRIEDLDQARARDGAVDALYEDLAWLGLSWDEGPQQGGPFGPYVQSERDGLYRAALEVLRAKGRAYPCVCSRREIEQATSAPHGVEPVYPGTCRGRDVGEVLRSCEARGRRPAWRFACEPGERVTARDRRLGAITHELARDVGDFVLMRADGVPAYQLAVVVDDVAMQIDDVVRGDDLASSAPRQVALARALGARFDPSFLHVPLVVGDDQVRLAKRHGSISVRSLRERGVSPEALSARLLESLGCALRPGSSHPLERAVATFDEAAIPPGPVALTYFAPFVAGESP